MIVNHVAQGWEILYHRGHALLAAQIASHWHCDKQPQRIAETITAIAQHDDLEREWQGDHLTEAGAPLDFTLGTPNLGFVEPWRTLITDALGRGRWVVLLTTMHISFLNGNKRGEDANLDAFLTEIAAQLRLSRGRFAKRGL